MPSNDLSAAKTTTSGGRARRLVVLLLIAGATTSCDQSSKSVIFDRFADSPPIEYLGGIFRLTLVLNRGGFLGLGETLGPSLRWWLFTIGVTVTLAMVAYMALSQRLELRGLAALGLILGGGLGNLLDRVLFDGVVRDFANVGLGPVRTGVFNLADVAILTGAAVLILEGWLSSSDDPDETAST
ncbi:MAG: signal peptidase II [Acidobacteriota bacterium]|nr:signal peptidase II [Acidobacteriota bacterium]